MINSVCNLLKVDQTQFRNFSILCAVLPMHSEDRAKVVCKEVIQTWRKLQLHDAKLAPFKLRTVFELDRKFNVTLL